MQHKLLGAALILIVTFLFALHDATAKYLSGFFAVPLLVWARYVGNLLILLVGVAPRMGWQLVATRRPGLMVMRAAMLAAVSLLFQSALKSLPLAETSALLFVTPLIVAMLAGPILGEKVRLGAWIAIVAGFGGTLLIARPGGAMTFTGVLYGLGAALCYAAYQLFTRAARETPAAILSTLLYMQLVWTVVLGWLVFDHLPDLPSSLGMLIIGASSLSIALQKRTPARPDDAPAN